jgi:hypothetical protein
MSRDLRPPSVEIHAELQESRTTLVYQTSSGFGILLSDSSLLGPRFPIECSRPETLSFAVSSLLKPVVHWECSSPKPRFLDHYWTRIPQTDKLRGRVFRPQDYRVPATAIFVALIFANRCTHYTRNWPITAPPQFKAPHPTQTLRTATPNLRTAAPNLLRHPLRTRPRSCQDHGHHRYMHLVSYPDRATEHGRQGRPA